MSILFKTTCIKQVLHDCKQGRYNKYKFDLARLYYKNSKETFVNLKHRNCLKRTFRNEKRIKTRIFKLLKPNIKQLIEQSHPNQYKWYIDKSHFDVLLYPAGGFFKPHRDDTSTQSVQRALQKGYRPYTYIYCLDSRIQNLATEQQMYGD